MQSFVTEIYECADGADALAAYERHHPDWVLMDVEMALTNGMDAMRNIRAYDPHSKICIVTDYDDEDLREEAAQVGAAYLVKDDLHLLGALLTEPVENQIGEKGFEN